MVFFAWIRRRAAEAVLQGIEDAAQHIASVNGDTGEPALVLRLPAPVAAEAPEPKAPAARGRKEV